MKKLIFIVLLTQLVSCGDDSSFQFDTNKLILSSTDSLKSSNSMGNFISTAIKESNYLDMAFYPSPLLEDQMIDGDILAIAKVGMSDQDIDTILTYLPDGIKDQFMVGALSGRRIKEFVYERALDIYGTELQVAGLKYDIHFQGGIPTVKNITKEDGTPIDNEKNYRVAVNNHFYFSGTTFPGYRYRNGFDFGLKKTDIFVSAKESIKRYLQKIKRFPDFTSIRARVVNHYKGSAGRLNINQIQGAAHISPYYGKSVTTTGIITAMSDIDRYPFGNEFYLQSETGDNNPKTSEAIHVFIREMGSFNYSVGDKIEVSGVVYEQITGTGLGRTTLREVSKIKVLSSGNLLPIAIMIGKKGRKIPTHHISTYFGNLNNKKDLVLTDAIDFYESLESMRIKFSNPRVLGFRGGQEDLVNVKPKGYLNLYFVVDGNKPHGNTTSGGGIILDKQHNPDILTLITNKISLGVDPSIIFNIGDIIEGDITAILSYEKNLFGDGAYTVLVPERQAAFDNFERKDVTPITERAKSKLIPDFDHLTIATYNVENLSGNQYDRLRLMGSSIATNLNCPDIVNLVEVQDSNGTDFDGTSTAQVTLERLIANIPCPNSNYKAINIDPVSHNEGGQPGGNIRVAMIYNASRVSFTPRGNSGALTENLVEHNGSLRHNPGRIFPNSDAFKRTRRSLIAEFEFKGEKVFVIGNHFNSKLGDSSMWSMMQPPTLNSEVRRNALAEQINKFINNMLKRITEAKVIVLGDFNANYDETSMRVLEGKVLKNLINYKNLVPKNARYTSNYNGSSHALDYIFASKSLLKMHPELEILHFNSDYMGRLSDHDPLIARFRFK